jgi:hypothetical protein
MYDVRVVCDPSYLAVVFGILEWIQIIKKLWAQEKITKKREEWTGSRYGAAVTNGRHLKAAGRITQC